MLEVFSFSLSRILTLEKDVLAILSILILHSRCHSHFHSRKLEGYVKTLLMELEMPTSNTQCCCALLVLPLLVTCSAGWKMGRRAVASGSMGLFKDWIFAFVSLKRKSGLGFSCPKVFPSSRRNFKIQLEAVPKVFSMESCFILWMGWLEQRSKQIKFT